MKRLLRIGVLCGMLTMLLCVSALADGSLESKTAPPEGMYNVARAADFDNDAVLTIVPDAAATENPNDTYYIDGVETISNYYAGATKLTVTYKAATNAKYYLVMAQTGTDSPTETTLLYIDQNTADNSDVSFTVYPGKLKNGAYNIYLSSNDDTAEAAVKNRVKVGEFSYFAPYPKGDVDLSKTLGGNDALLILQYLANIKTLNEAQVALADTDKSGTIGGNDALLILQVLANIKEFD